MSFPMKKTVGLKIAFNALLGRAGVDIQAVQIACTALNQGQSYSRMVREE